MTPNYSHQLFFIAPEIVCTSGAADRNPASKICKDKPLQHYYRLFQAICQPPKHHNIPISPGHPADSPNTAPRCDNKRTFSQKLPEQSRIFLAIAQPFFYNIYVAGAARRLRH
jgi:hypothetical protein